MAKPFYITSTIFYPNAKLHLGHAYTTTVCDILNRYHRLKGEESFFLTGADENTGKVTKASQEAGETVEEFLEKITDGFRKLYTKLDIEYDQFVRTTDKKSHHPSAIKLWNKLVESGDIYRGTYSGLYCPSCEAFYTEKDLLDGKCPLHHITPEEIKEENYFFKLSKYNDKIKKKIENDEFEIVPVSRKNEILALLERGLEDISFSRPRNVVPHGIPVPGDDTQVMYVWCDALVSYISGIGFATDEEKFNTYWPADVHVIGKDILRFHAAIWPAMLLSAGLDLPKKLLVHGLITSQGKKMSKSIGNVIDPEDLIREYGAEAVRYFLARHISLFEDGDLTPENFKEAYNANLANGLGNLASRVLTLSEKYLDKCPEIPEKSDFTDYFKFYNNFDLNGAANYVWKEIGELDKFIQEAEPFKLVKNENAEKRKEGRIIIEKLVLDLYKIARMLNPIMPETNVTLKKLIRENKRPEKPLFARKD